MKAIRVKPGPRYAARIEAAIERAQDGTTVIVPGPRAAFAAQQAADRAGKAVQVEYTAANKPVNWVWKNGRNIRNHWPQVGELLKFNRIRYEQDKAGYWIPSIGVQIIGCREGLLEQDVRDNRRDDAEAVLAITSGRITADHEGMPIIAGVPTMFLELAPGTED